MRILPILLLVTVTACGGGGGSDAVTSSPAPLAPEPPVAPMLAFEPSASYRAACEMPRSGTNPLTGLAFSDYQGSIELENEWLRSWSHENYLWYDEIVDQDPALFTDPLEYFGTLKTEATTPTGKPRDQFHFAIDTAQWNQLAQSGVSYGYGAAFVILQGEAPRKIVVSYVIPNSVAVLAGLRRGDQILRVDGIDAVNGNSQSAVASINAGLFPVSDGEPHSLEVLHVGENSASVIGLTSTNASSMPVSITTLATPTGNVGYLLFNEHIAIAENLLTQAISEFQINGISDLVLDLRYNGGGYLAIASELAYMIAGSKTSGRTFELLEFNDQHPVVNPITGEIIEPIPFLDESLGFSLSAGTSLPSLDLARVYILTGGGTCSASESIINGLRGINVEVIQIGETTCGKPYGFYPEDNCGTTYFSIQFSGRNDIGFSDYPDGFSPQNTLAFVGEPVSGCSVADDFSKNLGDPQEGRLAAALQYRDTATCPAPVPVSLSSKQRAVDLPASYSLQANTQPQAFSVRSLVLQNKILGLP